VLLTLLRVVRDQDTIDGILSQLKTMYPRQSREDVKLCERYLNYLKSKGADARFSARNP